MNARGVAVLIKRGLDIVVEQELLNSNGRLIVLKSLIKDKRYLLANIYGPNANAEALRFYQNLSATLRKMDPSSDDNIVVDGDSELSSESDFRQKRQNINSMHVNMSSTR